MGAMKIIDLTSDEAELIGKFMIRVFADLNRFVKLGGDLTNEALRSLESELLEELRIQLRAGSQNLKQPKEPSK